MLAFCESLTENFCVSTKHKKKMKLQSEKVVSKKRGFFCFENGYVSSRERSSVLTESFFFSKRSEFRIWKSFHTISGPPPPCR